MPPPPRPTGTFFGGHAPSPRLRASPTPRPTGTFLGGHAPSPRLRASPNSRPTGTFLGGHAPPTPNKGIHMASTTSATGKYLYGIINCGEERSFATPGIHEVGALVYTIPYKEIAAVVSDSPIQEYDSTRRNMLAHTRVLEMVMREYTVLPVCFGIVAPDARTVREHLLGEGYDQLALQLKEMACHIELGLKAFWIADDIFREIAEQSAEIRDLRDRIAGLPSEKTYYQRIKLGELVEAEVNQRRERDSAAILAQLEPLAYDLRIHPPITDRMVLNAAFLIDRTQEEHFDQAIRDLDAAMGQRLLFKYVGPVPLYNFVTIKVDWRHTARTAAVR
ncbi:MAG: GvpL/GvpF family gas vesicle protein [Candidatus Viridilinea halotolerans]|uniref:GvpL/GvpF family gas vesicle protein n=1 Tax=Candidatus Viridilinea halotolerans TaxID=2491704 RepID=A0A426TQX5_9CHLR|nr:MAG: GvpL/GvpF family gas vesicle protein [Candidatus Viridilinea halotolerans]